MVVSIEERREISRRNGAKSRGPKSAATKFISSRNSLKHGCYALVHTLDSEDPLEDLALRDRWFADVGPRTVDEEFLTEQCFRAHRLSNRVERARQDQLAKQIEAATAPWHDQRDASVAKLWKELAVTNDATDILAELRQTTLGIRALAQEVGRHREILDTQGYWGPDELGTMVILSGCATDPAPDARRGRGCLSALPLDLPVPARAAAGHDRAHARARESAPGPARRRLGTSCCRRGPNAWSG